MAEQPPTISNTGNGEPHTSPQSIPKIEGYQIVGKKPLGGGGMGIVWRAIQLGILQEVALKLIKAAHIGSERARQWFEREVRLAASLSIPTSPASTKQAFLRELDRCVAG